MERREFIMSAFAAGLVGSAAGSAPSEPTVQYLNLAWFRCRNDIDVQRMRSFLEQGVPAFNRADVKPVGVFQTSVGPANPSFLALTSYASMGALEETWKNFGRDEKWLKEIRAFEEKWEAAYERMESFLLRGFKAFPGIEAPKVEAGKSNVFELRMYESRSISAHDKKVAMFDSGEIDIFRRCGINPVFFGATVFGTRMPNLTYMVSYPSWEARAEAWSKFSQDPDWKKMSSAPGNANRELVSNISNQMMTALPFSQIK